MNYVGYIKLDIVVPDERPRDGKTLMTPGGAISLMAMALAMGEIAGVLILVRIHHEIVDGEYDVAVERPDILMLSYLTSSASRAFEVSDRAMRCIGPNGRRVAVVHGGFHATCLSEQASQHAHIVVRGEVTPIFLKSILEKAWAMDRNEHIITRLPEVPEACIERVAIDWRKVNISRYHLIGLLTSSGCPFECSFCVAPKLYGTRARFVPLQIIKAELATIPRRRIVAIIDDNFLQSASDEAIDRCLAVARLIHASGHSWVAELTTRTLIKAEERRPGFIRALARLGCIGLYFGLESTSDAKLRKSDPLDQVTRLLRRCQATGIMVLGAFVFGLPGDSTIDQVKKTLRFAIWRARLDYCQFTVAFPPPGSLDWINALITKALTSLNWAKYEGTKSVTKHPAFTPEQLAQMVREAYRRFYGTISVVWRLLHPANLIHPFAWLRRMKTSAFFNAILWLHARSWKPEIVLPDEQVTDEALAQLKRCAPFNVNEPRDGISVPL